MYFRFTPRILSSTDIDNLLSFEAIVNAVEQVMIAFEKNENMAPRRLHLNWNENVYSIVKLITGERKIDVNKTTTYKSTGMAIFDLFVAKEMYKAAIEKNIGTEIKL